MLDRLSPQARHYVLMLVAGLVSAGVVAVRDNLSTLLANVPPAIAPILTSFVVALLGSVLLWATNLTGQYGNGSPSDAPADPVTDVPPADPDPADPAAVDPAPAPSDAPVDPPAPAVGD